MIHRRLAATALQDYSDLAHRAASQDEHQLLLTINRQLHETLLRKSHTTAPGMHHDFLQTGSQGANGPQGHRRNGLPAAPNAVQRRHIKPVTRPIKRPSASMTQLSLDQQIHLPHQGGIANRLCLGASGHSQHFAVTLLHGVVIHRFPLERDMLPGGPEAMNQNGPVHSRVFQHLADNQLPRVGATNPNVGDKMTTGHVAPSKPWTRSARHFAQPVLRCPEGIAHRPGTGLLREPHRRPTRSPVHKLRHTDGISEGRSAIQVAKLHGLRRDPPGDHEGATAARRQGMCPSLAKARQPPVDHRSRLEFPRATSGVRIVRLLPANRRRVPVIRPAQRQIIREQRGRKLRLALAASNTEGNQVLLHVRGKGPPVIQVTRAKV